jgi:tRNA threonylcarbamoyladenosine biosynthesis protein TsaB
LRILAIDGAGPVAVAALVDGQDGWRLAASIARSAGNDADRLPGHAARCLDAAGWPVESVDLIACAVGPGGFTSIRTAVALARGLALAAGLPVQPVTSFEALAAAARREGVGGALRVVVPSGRAGWFVQDIGPDRAPAPPQLVESVPQAPAGMRLVGVGCPGALALVADARDVALAAAERVAAGERPLEGSALAPLYLRGADARVGAGRSLLDAAGA